MFRVGRTRRKLNREKSELEEADTRAVGRQKARPPRSAGSLLYKNAAGGGRSPRQLRVRGKPTREC